MKTLPIANPSIFLTDYASYNNGTQFEFGHWVDLTQFTDGDDVREYIAQHFKECDEKSPLSCGSEREEIMITDFEGMPRELYSESGMNWDDVMAFVNCDEHERIAAQILLANNQYKTFGECLEHAENINPIEYNGDSAEKWDLFEQYYPQAEELEQSNPYVSIDYDRFIKECFTEFEIDGQCYLVDDGELDQA